MSDTSFDIQITEKEWLKDAGKGAFHKAMDAGGQGWHDELTHYPPQKPAIRTRDTGHAFRVAYTQAPGNTAGGNRRAYKRTHALGNTASHVVAANGLSAKLIGKYYGKYVLLGTKYWEGWPGKLDLIKKRISSRYKAALKQAIGK